MSIKRKLIEDINADIHWKRSFFTKINKYIYLPGKPEEKSNRGFLSSYR